MARTRPLRVYFAGSIRGGRDDADLYRELIAHLRATTEVLTEHVGAPRDDDGELSDGDIFVRDTAWLASCDAIVAEVTTPSLGVGYELGLAESLGKPVLCLFRTSSGWRLSAMVAGNPAFTVAGYDSVADACVHIDRFLADREA